MRLWDILENVSIESKCASNIWESNPEINDLCYHSLEAQEKKIFFAIKGYKTDGHSFIKQAFQKGIALAVVDCPEIVDKKYINQCLIVSDARKALAQASANFFGHPTRNLILVGVTGSNGKTSCAHIIENIFKENGNTTALMSTIHQSYPHHYELSKLTTQESYEVQKFMHNAVLAGVTHVVMEVSSHALSLSRVVDCEFNAVLFNNLQEDHLDFHESMENYFQSKLKLFTEFSCSSKEMIGIANLDDSYGKRILKLASIPMKSFGLGNADFSGANLKENEYGITGEVKCSNGSVKIHSKLMGMFNYENITGSVSIASVLGVSKQVISAGIESIEEIPGRMCRVPTKLPYMVFVDFAHNGPALYKTLQIFRNICKNKLIVVFGSGGDRDPRRRIAMGEAAARFAHISIITTDNARSEDPQSIIKMIVNSWKAFVKKEKIDASFFIEPDRRSAIQKAFSCAKPKDIICIAGRGNEQNQVIGQKIIPFDDKKIALSILRELENA